MRKLVLVVSIALLAGAASPQAVQEKERGDRLAANGDLAGAKEAYENAAKISPTYAAALNELGSLMFKQDKADEAMGYFKRAIDADKSFPTAYFNLGYLLRKANKFTEAADAYKAYVGLEPNDLSGWFGLIESYKSAGDKANALAACDTYLARDDGKKPDRTAKVKATADQLRPQVQAAAAPAAATPTVVAAPAAAPAVVAAPAVTVAAAAAAPAATAAPAAGPAAAAPVAMDRQVLARQKLAEGQSLRTAGKDRDALFAFQDAVNADPNNEQAVFELGLAYAKLNYFPQAIQRWERVQATSTDPAMKTAAADNIARARQKMGGMAPPAGPAAVATATPAVATAPAAAQPAMAAQPAAAQPQVAVQMPPPPPPVAAQPAVVDPQQAFAQGVKLYTEAKYSEALAAFSQAIKAKPDFAQAFAARGSANLAMRDFAGAVNDYGQAMRLDQTLASPVFGVAESLLALGKRQESIPYYEAYVNSTASDVQPALKQKARERLAELKR